MLLRSVAWWIPKTDNGNDMQFTPVSIVMSNDQRESGHLYDNIV